MFHKKMLMANTQKYSNQMKKFLSKIIVLVCVIAFERLLVFWAS